MLLLPPKAAPPPPCPWPPDGTGGRATSNARAFSSSFSRRNLARHTQSAHASARQRLQAVAALRTSAGLSRKWNTSPMETMPVRMPPLGPGPGPRWAPLPGPPPLMPWVPVVPVVEAIVGCATCGVFRWRVGSNSCSLVVDSLNIGCIKI